MPNESPQARLDAMVRELLELDQKATPAPWTLRDGYYIEEINASTKMDANMDCDHLSMEPDQAVDAALIVLLRNAVPHILAFLSQLDAEKARADAAEAQVEALTAALRGLVKINEDWNVSVEKIIGRSPNWADDYLDEARAALKLGGDPTRAHKGDDDAE